MIKFELESLLLYGLFHEFYTKEDLDAIRGSLCETLKMPLYDWSEVKLTSPLTDISDILSRITKWAVEKELIPSSQPPYSDLFDTAIMASYVQNPQLLRTGFRDFTVNRLKWQQIGTTAFLKPLITFVWSA